MKLNKLVGLGLVVILGLGIVGCKKTEEEKMVDNNEMFVKKFSKAINERWDENKELEKEYSETSMTDSEYNKLSSETIQKEVDKIEKELINVTDEKLKKLAEDYVEGDKLQIKYLLATNDEIAWDYYEQSQKLRKPSLITLVEEYGVVVDEEHIDTYNGFKEEATMISKENEAKKVLDEMAMNCTVEKRTDEWGNVEYVVTFENNSNISFNLIQYDVNYKNKDGIVIGNDFISLTNFEANSKQQVTLFGYVDGIENVVITTNEYFEIK